MLKDSPAQEIVTAIHTMMSERRHSSCAVAAALSNAASPQPELTQREKEILELIADGLSSKEIAARLDLSVRTVETHRLNIKRKIDADGAASLVKYAIERKRSGF